MKKLQIVQILGGLLITAAGLYIFFRDVKIAELWKEIRATELWIIIAVAILNPVGLWFRAYRWKIILPVRQKADKQRLFPLVMIGFMVNNILPARLGEAARAVFLWKRNGYSVAESVGSLLMERFIDTIVFATFFILPVFFIKELSTLFLYALLLSFFVAGIVFLFLVYSRMPEPTRHHAKKIIGRLPQRIQTMVIKIGAELISNLDWVFHVRKVFAVMILSFVIILCQAGMMYALGRGLERFGILDSMFGVAFAAVGAAIPLAPGYVGTLHATLLRGLSMVGVHVDKAGAMAILYHAIGYMTVTTIGLYYFFSTKISFREIGKAKEDLGS